MRNAFINTLINCAEADDRVALLMAEVGFSVVEPFHERFPERFINTGIAEQDMINAAAGMALAGMRPVAYSMSAFLASRAFEQIKVNVCYQELPVVMVSVGTGMSYGEMGPTHHALEESAIMRSLPNLTVIFPADPEELGAAIRYGLSSEKPTFISFPKAPVRTLPDHEFCAGRAVYYRTGADGAVIASGYAIADAMAVADELARNGAELSVYGLHTVKPLDKEAIISAGRTGRVFVIDEHSSGAGIGGDIARVLLEGGIAPKVFKVFDLQDRYADRVLRYAELMEHYGMTVGQLCKGIGELL